MQGDNQYPQRLPHWLPGRYRVRELHREDMSYNRLRQGEVLRAVRQGRGYLHKMVRYRGHRRGHYPCFLRGIGMFNKKTA